MTTSESDAPEAGNDMPQALRLKETAYSLARDAGLAALSARSLARETGMSPSAINYYFGNRELLISEICDRAIATSRTWREGRAAAQENRVPAWADLDDVFTSLLQDRLSQGTGVLALLQELEHEAAGCDQDGVLATLKAETAAEAAFWRELATSFGETSQASEAWASLALGLTSLLLSEPEAPVRSAWISAPATRLRQRLSGQPVTLVRLGGPDAARLASEAPANETAENILRCALEVIAEKGPERLVQREVASRAGVSLASITYFFRTKTDLISAAFSELCRMHCATLTDEALLDDRPIEESLAFHDRASLSGMAAMDALLRASVRMPELAATADLIRQTRGVASLVLLRKGGLMVDHLDAYLWACLHSGRYRMIRLEAPDQHALLMDKAAVANLCTVFPRATA
ncbi:TetR family transcriptional regulator [Novosphingobium sp. BL-8A]|uniref:TetR family transcriptional regulator n=1 Tax=Novosphingobium sp. BL-8A TaxID=3127639 RepID=UPI003757DA98